MSGTIRCRHGYVMEIDNTSEHVHKLEGDSVILVSKDVCILELPLVVYENTLGGANFTHVFFHTEEGCKKFIKGMDSFIGSSIGRVGSMWHLVY
jgi:hypothetical protein